MAENKKIVLIDDEPDFVQNVQSYFEMHGYECLAACNGQEGLELIEKERPALMILDILMPNMDGYTMLRELKKRRINMMCIVMTAKEKLKDLFELEKVDRFLTKPFELHKLKEIVAEMLATTDKDSTPAVTVDPSTEGTGKTILIIEDEVKLAESIRQFLEIKGYTAHVAFSGEDGLESVLAAKPDLICTDIMMPGMDGYSLIKELRKKDRTIPIVVMSGKDKMKELIEIEGISAFLQKPFDLGSLEETLKKVLLK
jgi:DNA-binding response OmpR family regulator